MADDEVEEDANIARVGVVEEEKITKVVKALPPPLYEVRPGLGQKFQAANVKDIILTSMQQLLMGRQYRADQATQWVKAIANGVRQRVQELEMKRYKILVQTTIMEMKGAGIKCGQRCIWDPETDDYAADSYKNDTIFCYTIVYGVYMY